MRTVQRLPAAFTLHQGRPSGLVTTAEVRIGVEYFSRKAA
jgi:hypothetical protein